MPKRPKFKPLATRGGKAHGTPDAEKNEIESVGCGPGGGIRFCAHCCIFSGIFKNDGILYLKKIMSGHVPERVKAVGKLFTSPECERVFLSTPIRNHSFRYPAM